MTNHYETVINITIMKTTILQIPMPKSLKISAQEVAFVKQDVLVVLVLQKIDTHNNPHSNVQPLN